MDIEKETFEELQRHYELYRSILGILLLEKSHSFTNLLSEVVSKNEIKDLYISFGISSYDIL